MEPNPPMPQPPCSDEMLVAFAVGDADAATQAIVRAALANTQSGPTLRERLGVIQDTLEGLARLRESSALFAVTPAQRDALAALMGVRATNVGAMLDAAGQALREVIATLVFDSASAAPAVGYRGGAHGARLMRAQAEGVVIDLRVEPAEFGDGATISGQVLAEPGGAAKAGPMVWLHRVVAISRSTGAKVEAPGESDGYFEVEVGGGTHDLQVEVDGRLIVVRGVGASPSQES